MAGEIDAAFATRIESAYEKAPHAPQKRHGRLTWLAREIHRREGVEVTIETIRKWFTGETKPRGKNLEALAGVLDCDSAWLMMGVTPVGTRKEVAKAAIKADGALYLVLGRMLLDGVNAALPEPDDRIAAENAIDLYAIVGARQRRISVTLARKDGESWVASPRMPCDGNDILVVVPEGQGVHTVFHIPPNLFKETAQETPDHAELQFTIQRGKMQLWGDEGKTILSIPEMNMI